MLTAARRPHNITHHELDRTPPKKNHPLNGPEGGKLFSSSFFFFFFFFGGGGVAEEKGNKCERGGREGKGCGWSVGAGGRETEEGRGVVNIYYIYILVRRDDGDV